LPDAEGSLADVAAAFQNGTRLTIADGPKPRTPGGPRKDDEEEDLSAMRKSFKLGPPPEQANSSRAVLDHL